MKKVTVVLAGLMLAIMGAVTTSQADPTPSPTPEPSTTSQEVETAGAPPTAFPSPPTSPSPVPILYLKGVEYYTAGGKNWVRHQYDVLNKAVYPAALFAPAPNLPPCGANANSSRTWVDFFDQNGKRLYGFCALTKPADLGDIWFATEEGVIPPSWIYIEINDRQTNTKYKSNLADTTP
jgi:hypothetical protein